MAELWKQIEGYDGWYEVSDLGRLRSYFHRGCNIDRKIIPTIMKQTTRNKYGHLRVVLYKNKESKGASVHRLVAIAFLGPCPRGMECAHIDGNPSNNAASNLVWVTHKENLSHRSLHGTALRGETANGAKLTENQVREIRYLCANGQKQRDIAAIYNVAQGQISLIHRRETWGHVF